MSDDSKVKIVEKKKIIGLRTFADDVKRVRKENEDVNKDGLKGSLQIEDIHLEPEEVTLEEPTTVEDAIPKIPTPAKSSLQQNIIATEESDSNEVDGVIFENDSEIPPFHNIRASSPEDTTFKNPQEIPDIKTLREEAVRSTPESSLSKNTQTKNFDLGDEITAVTSQKQAPSLQENIGTFDIASAEQNLGEATIITDQKQKRFSTFSAIIHSLKFWAVDTKKDFESKHKEKKSSQKIQKSSQRRDVITKAGERTKQVPKNDYAIVRERLKGVPRAASSNAEFSIKEKDEATQRPWSHLDANIPVDNSKSKPALTNTSNTKTASASITTLEKMIRGNESESQPKSDDILVGYESLPGYKSETIKESKNEAEAPSSQKKNTASVTIPSPKNISNTEATKPVEKSIKKTTSDGYQMYREQYGEEYVPAEEVFLENLPPQAETASTASVTTPYLNTTPVPKERVAWANQKQRVENVKQKQARSAAPYLTLAVVVIFAVLLGAGTSIWWFTRDMGNNITSTKLSPAITETVPLTADRNIFLKAIQDAISEKDTGTTYVTPTIGNTEASTQNILNTLALQADGSFIRNINAIEFGAHKNVPFVVMHISSFDAAFGGVLLWESSMVNDLSPLFGNSVRTAAKDVRISNIDTRIMTDEAGLEVLVYGFVDKQTILIAPTRDVFTEVFQSLR